MPRPLLLEPQQRTLKAVVYDWDKFSQNHFKGQVCVCGGGGGGGGGWSTTGTNSPRTISRDRCVCVWRGGGGVVYDWDKFSQNHFKGQVCVVGGGGGGGGAWSMTGTNSPRTISRDRCVCVWRGEEVI